MLIMTMITLFFSFPKHAPIDDLNVDYLNDLWGLTIGSIHAPTTDLEYWLSLLNVITLDSPRYNEFGHLACSACGSPRGAETWIGELQ
jgi:hypothetical protein